MMFSYNFRGQLVYDNFTFSIHGRNGKTCGVHWRCTSYTKTKCSAVITTRGKDYMLFKVKVLNKYLHISRSISIPCDNLLKIMPTTTYKDATLRYAKNTSFIKEPKNFWKTNTKFKEKKSITINKLPVIHPVVISANSITSDNIVKTSLNNHHLVTINKPRLRGICVCCIRAHPESRKTMHSLPKIITYCPECPGGEWMCENCFDRLHNRTA